MLNINRDFQGGKGSYSSLHGHLKMDAAYASVSIFFMWGNSPPRAWVASLLRFLDHTQLNTHPVGILRTSDQLVAEAAAYTDNKQETNVYALGGIRTQYRSNQAGFRP